jgi:hypothetical protein
MSKKSIIVANDELGSMWKETVVAKLEVLSRNLPKWTGGNNASQDSWYLGPDSNRTGSKPWDCAQSNYPRVRFEINAEVYRVIAK